MPPRRSERVASAVARARAVLPPLPPPLVLRIFALLPLDARLRCREVSRAWRDTLAEERSLWATLDLRDVAAGAPAFELLRAAARLAGGAVTCIHLRGVRLLDHELIDLVRSCAASLREVRAPRRGAGLHNGDALHPFTVEALLRAAPALRALHADLHFRPPREDNGCLRGAPPCGPLRVRRLSVVARGEPPDVLATLAADCAAHEGLRELSLAAADFETADATWDAFVDVAHARRLVRLCLHHCPLGAHTAPALVRLLGAGSEALQVLVLTSDGEPALDAAGGAAVGDALHANSTLTSLTLCGSGVVGNARACEALLRGARGHVSLRILRLCTSDAAYLDVRPPAADAAILGNALGALLAANAPALTRLDVSDCRLGDAALTALFDGLRANTHLQHLDVSGNDASRAATRNALLRAVRACGSRRTLCAARGDASPVEAHAEGLVMQRIVGGSLERATDMARSLNGFVLLRSMGAYGEEDVPRDDE